MKQICRDFTVVVGVPDDVKPEDCEIVIDKVVASYPYGDTAVVVDEENIDINVEEPYEHV